ncbi:protein yippee-like [Senna tora]|uniref:Protein yippee-like n=1 Tax=Senna tora TaxID=362788 RepID=A0A834W2H4_9FABA|nr:protein yippee-like [Senna tora]
MGRVFLVDLEGRAYRCRFCDSPLALAEDVLSRGIYELAAFSCFQENGGVKFDGFEHRK